MSGQIDLEENLRTSLTHGEPNTLSGIGLQGSRMVNALKCAFCENPRLFQTDFSNSQVKTEIVSARGQFWKRIQNDRYPAWLTPAVGRENGDVHSKLLIGKDHFGPRWQLLTVEILGYNLTDKPPMPPIPLFGVTSTRGLETVSYILWNACRITHEEFSFVVNLHWWPSHERVFTVEKFDFEDTAARSALNTALSLFAPGRGKPSEYFKNNKQFFDAIRVAVMRRYDEGVAPESITEIEIAEELFPEANDGARTLRRWLQTSWRKWKWKDVVKSIVDSVTRDREEREDIIHANNILQ